MPGRGQQTGSIFLCQRFRVEGLGFGVSELGFRV